MGLGLALAALFTGLAVRGLDWHELARTLGGINPAWLLPAVLALLVDFSLRIVRWHGLLRPHHPGVRPMSLATPFMGSLALNSVLPLRAGDVLRVVGFRRQQPVPRAVVLGAMVVERVCDLASILAILFVALVLAPPSEVDARWLTVAGVVTGAAVAGIVVAAWLHDPLERLVRASAGMLPGRPGDFAGRIADLAAHVLRSFAVVRSPASAVRLAGLSMTIWIVEGLAYVCVAQSIPAGIPMPSSWFVMGLATLGTAIPGAPGAVGTYDFFARQAAQLSGATDTHAAAMAILIHGVIWVFVTGTGFALLAANHFWRSLPSVPSTTP